MPCDNRHVLGWYRLIRELKESEVGVICVFDGQVRSQAKQPETDRRRKLREMDVARGATEIERLRRLRRLTNLLKQYQALPQSARAQFSELSRNVVAELRLPQNALGTLRRTAHNSDYDISVLANEPKSRQPTSFFAEYSGSDPYLSVSKTSNRPTDHDKRPSKIEDPSLNVLKKSDNNVPGHSFEETQLHDASPESSGGFLGSLEDSPQLTGNSRSPDPVVLYNTESESLNKILQGNTLYPDLDTSPFNVDSPDVAPSPDDISQSLVSLYQNYQQSIPAFMSPVLDTQVEETSEEPFEGVRERQAMSKHQFQLTLDEGNIWNSLINSSSTDNLNIEDQLELLAQKSDSISKSYEKRNKPPTPQTYAESKLILRAMGVPCIESVVPYEAEALAASLVHHGLADYVASEDTDVLVYDAPLLRNITNRQSPLFLLSSSDIRQFLELDHEAFIDFALLLGTDFSQRIKNIGPHRAIKLIRTYGCIEHLVANEPKFTLRLPQDAYLRQVRNGRLVFRSLPPVPDPSLLQPKESDDKEVAALLDRFGVHRAAMVDWDFASALDGNYFDDDPTMI